MILTETNKSARVLAVQHARFGSLLFPGIRINIGRRFGHTSSTGYRASDAPFGVRRRGSVTV